MSRRKIMTADKRRIVKMRRQGFSIKEIATNIHCGKSTVASYIKGVDVLPEFYNRWKSKIGGNTARADQRRQESYIKAKGLVGSFSLRDQLLIAAVLYWGEGNKKEFSFSNIDPRLIETFLRCLDKLGVTKDRIKVGIRIYEDIDPTKAKAYWAKIAGISPSEIISVNVLSGKKVGKAPFGMCRIRLTNGNDYYNLIMAVVRLIGENFALVAQRTEQWTPKP